MPSGNSADNDYSSAHIISLLFVYPYGYYNIQVGVYSQAKKRTVSSGNGRMAAPLRIGDWMNSCSCYWDRREANSYSSILKSFFVFTTLSISVRTSSPLIIPHALSDSPSISLRTAKSARRLARLRSPGVGVPRAECDPVQLHGHPGKHGGL